MQTAIKLDYSSIGSGYVSTCFNNSDIIQAILWNLINGHFGDKEFCPLQGGVRYWECLT